MNRFHFIGICGTAMATVAAMLKQKGFRVSGSDQDIYPPMSDFLAAEGIPALAGYRAEHITADLDLVVVGNAISRGNPELEEVLDRRIRYCSLPEVIREHFLWGARSVVVAGTHGKTTTAALAGWVLTSGGLDPSVIVGGIARNFGAHGSSYRLGHGREFVIEGDEYDSAFFDKTAKFLKYLPDIAVVNNVEFDHADIYDDFDAVSLAFRRLVTLVPRRGLLLIGADSAGALALKASAMSRVETFGLGEDLDWQAHGLAPAAAGATVSRQTGGGAVRHLRDVARWGAQRSQCAGRHRDRVGARSQHGTHRRGTAVLRRREATARSCRRCRRGDGVRRFRAPSDRRRRNPGRRARVTSDARIWAVFEPRSASSCRRVFQDDFARAFAAADEVLLAPVFRSTLPESERLSLPHARSTICAARASPRERPTRSTTSSGRSSTGHRPGDLVVDHVKRRVWRDPPEAACRLVPSP